MLVDAESVASVSVVAVPEAALCAAVSITAWAETGFARARLMAVELNVIVKYLFLNNVYSP